MKTLTVIASALGIAFSTLVLSATLESNQTKKKSNTDDLLADVVREGYFQSEKCGNYLNDLTLIEKDLLVTSYNLLEVDEILTYAVGGNSIIEEVKISLENQGYSATPTIDIAREKLKDSPDLIKFYSDDMYSADKVKAAGKAYFIIVRNKENRSEPQNNIIKYGYCRIATIVSSVGAHTSHLEKYVAFVQSRADKAQVGYFEVTAEKGTYGPRVGTGNQFAEPKIWEGSRFFIVHASFKNIDTESRLPVEGSLLINYNGKEYKFDSIEPISLQGYNIWFRTINPLVTMKTKIVYRIPNEIHGEVFWKPGRNTNDVRLWLGFIEQAK